MRGGEPFEMPKRSMPKSRLKKAKQEAHFIVHMLPQEVWSYVYFDKDGLLFLSPKGREKFKTLIKLY